MEYAKCIDKSSFDKITKPLTLFIGETVLADIGFRVGEIIFGISDIEISAKNHRLLFLQFLTIRQKSWIPLFMTEREPPQIFFGIRRIDRHDIKPSNSAVITRPSPEGSP